MSSVGVVSEAEGTFSLVGSTTDKVCESLNGFANNLMAIFWKGEQNVQYLFLPHLPGRLSQETSKAHEYAKRLLMCTVLTLALFFAPKATLLSLVGFATLLPIGFGMTAVTEHFHSREFRYLSGSVIERNGEGTSRALHLNACMLPGGMPALFGGMSTAGERFPALVQFIKDQDHDIVFLCEYSRTMGGKLYQALRDDYAHFFLDIGLSAKGMECSYFIACRDKIVTPPVFVPSPASEAGDHKGMRRGYFLLETEKAWYIYTHLNGKNTEIARHARQNQLDEVVAEIKKRTGQKPVIFLGDLNIDQISQSTDYQQMLDKGFSNPREGQPIEHTCTNKFEREVKGKEDGEQESEVIDYALVYNKETSIDVDVQFVDTWEQRLSDHKAMSVTIYS